MKLTDKFLTKLIEHTENVFTNYERKPHLNDEDLIKETSDLYENKNIILVTKNSYQIDNILKETQTPWVYHYSLNLNWVVFFNNLYEKMWLQDLVNDDVREIYLKTWRLELIFNHVDGIIESGDKIYLVRDDVKLIQKDLRRFTLS